MSENFTKPLSMGYNIENGFFDGINGGCGFNVGAYAGRLNMNFWKKGEKSSENKDNKVSIGESHIFILNGMLQSILKSRVEEYRAGKPYSDISNFYMNVSGYIDGKPVVFSTIKFDTVEVEGVKRIQITVGRNSTVNSVVLCDMRLVGEVEANTSFGTTFDVGDVTFLRLCNVVSQWSMFMWQNASMQKLFNVVANKNGGGNSGGGSYNKPTYSPRGGNSGGGNSGGGNGIYQDDELDF